MSPAMALLRKELTEELISARSAGVFLACSVILSVFALLLIGNTELSLLDNAQAVYLMCSIVLVLGVLISIVRGADSYAGERERQTLESLLLTPVRGRDIALAKLGATTGAWLVAFALASPYVWAVGSTGQNLAPALAYLFVSGLLLSLVFGGILLLLSVRARSLVTTLSIGLAIFLLAGSPVVMGPSLRQSSVGRLIDSINPVAHGVNMLDSVIVDSQGLSFQTTHLAALTGWAGAVLLIVFIMTRKVQL